MFTIEGSSHDKVALAMSVLCSEASGTRQPGNRKRNVKTMSTRPVVMSTVAPKIWQEKLGSQPAYCPNRSSKGGLRSSL